MTTTDRRSVGHFTKIMKESHVITVFNTATLAQQVFFKVKAEAASVAWRGLSVVLLRSTGVILKVNSVTRSHIVQSCVFAEICD